MAFLLFLFSPNRALGFASGLWLFLLVNPGVFVFIFAPKVRNWWRFADFDPSTPWTLESAKTSVAIVIGFAVIFYLALFMLFLKVAKKSSIAPLKTFPKITVSMLLLFLGTIGGSLVNSLIHRIIHDGPIAFIAPVLFICAAIGIFIYAPKSGRSSSSSSSSWSNDSTTTSRESSSSSSSNDSSSGGGASGGGGASSNW